ATTRIRLGKDLAQSWTTREILHAAELHLEEFDVVHSVVALHRIAKSTDRGELRHDQRLTAVLAKLAATAATATTVSPSSNEMPHVKEVSKALPAPESRGALQKLRSGGTRLGGACRVSLRDGHCPNRPAAAARLSGTRSCQHSLGHGTSACRA
ncbi:unnamed protein product, partial [Symbiodinium microadriaticum]